MILHVGSASVEQVRSALRQDTIVILEEDSGSYIQAGGGPWEYTVEARLVGAGGSFTHWKARRSFVTGGAPRYVLIGEQAVKLDAAEVLPPEVALSLLANCLDGIRLAQGVEWAEISHWFEGDRL